MSAAVLALVLILSVLVFATLAILLYESLAVRRRDDEIHTISAWWHRWHRGRLAFRISLGVLLVGLCVFLVGDLAVEAW
jgi:hypothetical protein